MYYCLNLLCPISIFMVLYLESRIVLTLDLFQDCPSSPLSTRKVGLPDPGITFDNAESVVSMCKWLRCTRTSPGGRALPLPSVQYIYIRLYLPCFSACFGPARTWPEPGRNSGRLDSDRSRSDKVPWELVRSWPGSEMSEPVATCAPDTPTHVSAKAG